MGAKQEHTEVLGQLAALCATMVAECEAALAQQEADNLAAAKRAEEEEEKWAEVTRQVVEKEEKAKEEKLKERERKREEITAAECELAAQKRALLEVERALEYSNDSDLDNNVRSQSFIAENPVSVQVNWCLLY